MELIESDIPTESDPLVQRIEKQGGIIIGKTNTPELGAGASTFNDVFGYTANPWDTSKSCAGSSGGSAASIASGDIIYFWQDEFIIVNVVFIIIV